MPAQHYPDRRFAARTIARRAMLDLARDAGTPIIASPAFPGGPATSPDLAPLAGLNASRRIEIAAREHVSGYIRAARAAGHTWHDIGTAMSLVPNGDAQQVGNTVAEAAFTYAAGHPDTEHARRYGRWIGWTCKSCDQPIIDYGLRNGPADDEQGHTEKCPGHVATIAAWNAEWDALDTDWEADQ